MCIQVQANLSMAELEASDANTKYWLQMQNIGRKIGESCGEKYGSPWMFYIVKDSQQVLKLAWTLTGFVLQDLFQHFMIFNILVLFRLTLQRWQIRGSLPWRLGGERRPLLLLRRREEELDRGWGLLSWRRRTSGYGQHQCHQGVRFGRHGKKKP